MLKFCIATAVLLCLTIPASAQDANRLVVHEWGTFTSLQDESGKSIGGIAEDVEPLPSFIKSLGGASADSKGLPPPTGINLASSITRPDITMRLETPVVYFHLPKGSDPINVDFSATFRGGLLSQWYPQAINTRTAAQVTQTTISEQTVNELTWKNITVGGTAGKFPQTTSHVWLAPREVDAANVTVGSDSERYLFYRGVGHLDAPLKVIREGQNLRGAVQSNVPSEQAVEFLNTPAWLVSIRPDGSCAYREMLFDHPFSCRIQMIPSEFSDTAYSSDRLTSLRSEMKASLITAGLFDDEAEAMLNTWRESYFKSSGTRVLFIVPRSWTDSYLPIKLSQPAKIERVMVGRIDLVTPAQRDLARQYRKLTAAKDTQAPGVLKQIGRFGTAIVANESSRKPTSVSQNNEGGLR